MPTEQTETAYLSPSEEVAARRAENVVRKALSALMQSGDHPSPVLSGALYAVAVGDIAFRREGITLEEILNECTEIYRTCLIEQYELAVARMN